MDADLDRRRHRCLALDPGDERARDQERAGQLGHDGAEKNREERNDDQQSAQHAAPLASAAIFDDEPEPLHGMVTLG